MALFIISTCTRCILKAIHPQKSSAERPWHTRRAAASVVQQGLGLVAASGSLPEAEIQGDKEKQLRLAGNWKKSCSESGVEMFCRNCPVMASSQGILWA